MTSYSGIFTLILTIFALTSAFQPHLLHSQDTTQQLEVPDELLNLQMELFTAEMRVANTQIRLDFAKLNKRIMQSIYVINKVSNPSLDRRMNQEIEEIEKELIQRKTEFLEIEKKLDTYLERIEAQG